MDAAFEILLPMNTDIIFRFEQPTFEWEGVKYPQGPPEYLYDPNYNLVKSSIRMHIISKLPESYKEIDWQCIEIIGEGLQNYRTNLLDIGLDYNDDKLSQLLKDLIAKESQWVVVFEPDYDFHCEVLRGGISTVIDKLRFSLGIEKSGFIIYKDPVISTNLIQ